MRNIYDYDYRWRFVASGDFVLYENDTGYVIDSIEARALVGRFRAEVAAHESMLKECGSIPKDAVVDHFALPSQIVL